MSTVLSSIAQARLVAAAAAALVGAAILWGCYADPGTGAQETVGSQAPEEATVTEPYSTEPRRAERRKVEVVRVLPHDPQAFTQGLLWWDGSLWESTGQYRVSEVRRVDPETGEVLHKAGLTPDLFGEGLARVGDVLYQLTWREGVALRWKLPDLTPDGRLSYVGEGWGLCFDGEHLVWSDGSSLLRFIRPEDFSVVRELQVTLEGKPLQSLNELECVDGRIWANVWTTEYLAEIDPATGRVETFVDASGLLTREERIGTDVLNGIAHHPESGHFFITGKLWPKMFEVRLGQQSSDPSETRP